VGPEQPGLAVAQQDVSLGNLPLAGPEALDLPAFERKPRFDRLFDKIVEARTLILRDGVGVTFVGFSGRDLAMILE
jgi:hypothetical protein